ncbi:MAG: methyltransferase domain-containing protein [Chloroflexi bacterium]|nr:methyltransferase domain-containing protein [Chloroflexota bacterium]
MVDRDWADFYRWTLGREPRPLFERVMAHAGTPGQAVEVGFGDGTETLALLDLGWRVLAIDPAPAAADVLLPRVPPDALPRLTIVTAPAQVATLPPLDLFYSGFSLPFLPPAEFDVFWAGLRAALRPGATIVVNLFGPKDSWAPDEAMSFVDRDRIEGLIDGLELLVLDEVERDGEAFSGAKHWHVFDIVARRPTVAPEP